MKLTKKQRRKKPILVLSQRVSVWVNPELWKRFLSFVVLKHGTTKKVSEEVNGMLEYYLKKLKTGAR